MTTITAVDVHDVRFPTSQGRHGSDAMNPFPDYSAAYVVLRTARGRARDVGWLFWLIAMAFLVYFAIDPIERALGVS